VICINQKDENEKAKQILFMRDIYHHAEEVLIWLAEPDADDAAVKLAIELLNKLHGEPRIKAWVRECTKEHMTEGLLRPKSLMLGSRAITLSLGILF
jgi:hypothetical protein